LGRITEAFNRLQAEGRKGFIPYITGGDPDLDGVCETLDDCPGWKNYDQYDADEDGQGDACDLTAVTYGWVANCATTSPDRFFWLAGQYDKFRVYVSWDPAFSGKATVTSGKRLLQQTGHWDPTQPMWHKICAHAGENLYVRILGKDLDRPKSDPAHQRFSDVLVIPVQR